MNINKVITEKLPIAVLAIFIAAIAVLLPRGLEKYDVSTFKKPTFTVQESSTNTEGTASKYYYASSKIR